MPIEFSCECGKAYKVADQYAGKRTKCTACGKAVLVPTPATATPAVEESAEDAALRALMDGVEDEPTPARRSAGRAEYSPPLPPTPPRPSAPPPQYTPKSKQEPAPTYRSNSDAAPKKKPSPNWAKVGGGVAMAVGGLIGTVLVFTVLERAPRIVFAAPIAMFLASPFFIIDGFRDRNKK